MQIKTQASKIQIGSEYEVPYFAQKRCERKSVLENFLKSDIQSEDFNIDTLFARLRANKETAKHYFGQRCLREFFQDFVAEGLISVNRLTTEKKEPTCYWYEKLYHGSRTVTWYKVNNRNEKLNKIRSAIENNLED